jgi:hypothetical protein
MIFFLSKNLIKRDHRTLFSVKGATDLGSSQAAPHCNLQRRRTLLSIKGATIFRMKEK